MQWFRRFMAGRYGTDSLNRFLSILSMVLLLLSLLTGWMILYPAALFLLVCSMFRGFSRNLWKRSRENQVFLKATGKITAKFRPIKAGYQQRKTHRFYKCQSCRTTLRVPKGRGRMVITCPKCNMSFEGRT